MKLSLIVRAALLVVLGAVTTALACGPPDVCDDVSSSYAGNLETSGVVLTWSTDDENSSVAYYRLLRYDCGTPETCTEFLATVSAVGTCSELEEYDWTDDDGDSSWTYSLEVWNSSNVRECTVDTTPQ